MFLRHPNNNINYCFVDAHVEPMSRYQVVRELLVGHANTVFFDVQQKF